MFTRECEVCGCVHVTTVCVCDLTCVCVTVGVCVCMCLEGYNEQGVSRLPGVSGARDDSGRGGGQTVVHEGEME